MNEEDGSGPTFDESPRFERISANEEFVQHPIKVVEAVVQAAIIAAFIAFCFYTSIAGSGEEFADKYSTYVALATFLSLVGATAWVSYWRWKRTTIKFGETEVTVFRDTVFKKEIRIAYTKIASINVNCGIINRLTNTSRLMININSNVNANAPELTLTFGVDVSDRIRANLSQTMYRNNNIPADDATIPSIVTITRKDVVLHGLLSQPTGSVIFGIIMFAFGIYEMIVSTGDFASGLIAIALAFVSYVLPVIAMIFHYFNYKIYRIGDTIYISHGFIRTYNKSFKVSKINAVRIRSPLIPRLIKRYMLDAEVVGLASNDNNNGNNIAPLLCPMKDIGTIEKVMSAIVPEFVYDTEMKNQPKEAAKPIFIRATLWSLIFAVIAYVFYDTMRYVQMDGWVDTEHAAAVIIIVSAVAVAGLFINGAMSRRIVQYGKGEDKITFLIGVVDRKIATMSYDKIQIAEVESGPFSRPYGLARCNISLLSSIGSQKIKSGYFDAKELEAISEEVIARIKDGRYDYRKYY
ncbi:MAG: putative rane protein [Candidatus Methanomethylophilaceae archaeon]|nr:putative rane protein [Candidatus Methanomethylophilaceae archaeon]